VQIVGYSQALEICATAGPVDAVRAEQLGLANAVISRADLESGAATYLDTLRTVDPRVSRSVKALMVSAASSTPLEQLAAERSAQLPLLRRLNASIG